MAAVALLLAILSQLSGVPAAESKPPELSMRVESGQVIVASGYENTLLCTIEIPPGYHIYWSSAGASGAPTDIVVDAPEWCTVGPVRFPRPSVFSGAEGDTYGYADAVTFVIPFVPKQTLEPLELGVTARWLACRKACFMGKASQRIRLQHAGHIVNRPTPACTAAMAVMPKPIADRPDTVAQLEDGKLIVTGPIGEAGTPSFISRDIPGVVPGESTLQVDETRFRLVVPFEYSPDDALGADPVVSGLLLEGTQRTQPAWAITIPISLSPEEEAPE
jgi:DsbC/DsbD-like thiol-disulfide interchange protein